MKKYQNDYLSTKFFGKLNNELILSKKLGISLINCKVKNRYNYISYEINNQLDLENKDDYFIEIIDKEISKEYYDVNLENLYKNKKEIFDIILKEMFDWKINDGKSLIDELKDAILSSNIIVKYTKEYEKRENIDNRIIEYASEKRENQVVNYIYFISFLLKYNEMLDNKTYPSKDFMNMIDSLPLLFIQNLHIINDNRKKGKLSIGKNAIKTFINTVKKYDDKTLHIKELKEKKSINLFKYYKNDIKRISGLIEEFISENYYYDQFEYISNCIYVADNSYDDRTSILLFSSVLESILTHNPDSNRFNVEDSISKQFSLKICIVLEKEIKNFQYDKYIKRCKFMYDVRSNIIHGNSDSYSELVKKCKKLYPLDEKLINDINTVYDIVKEELRNICFNVINYYLKNKEYITFLKNN